MVNIKPLTTSVIGSYAWPAWYVWAVEAIRRGEFGPRDVEETLNDAVDWALREQEEAGVDILSDGEMRRLGFFTAGFYGRLKGLHELAPERRLGIPGHDQRERYEAVEPLAAPEGLGVVHEYVYARQRTQQPLKVTCPGPFTLAGRILPGKIYRDRIEVAYALADIINAELRAVIQAGADFVQLDEPSMAVHGGDPKVFLDLLSRTLNGVGVRKGLHLCFGNFMGRPVARRRYRLIFPNILDAEVDELALEFANREMAEVEIAREVAAAGKTLAAGVVDVKNYYIETPEEIAERIRSLLTFIAPERLVIVPDCGFSQTARWAARAKLRAMVAGAHIVRHELGLE
ncbi:hypothetical protein [uncultured Thermanaerothrix sp.]|uniref:hypothetical protein n=1 Tax=uncultured Thermanaerothrix sp. TaxID=1195149 RepID=UPI002624B368|nr:hypothetical protein [uncultured Thermanaerothrix sp.]